VRSRARLASLATTTLIAALLNSCERGAPFVVPSQFELLRADGAPLPVLLRRDSTCVTELHGATLMFSRDQKFDATYRIRKACLQGTVDSVPDPGSIGRFVMRGDSIQFYNTMDKPAGKGVASADSVVIRGPQHVLTFHRVARD
jgi:hypothetical protein